MLQQLKEKFTVTVFAHLSLLQVIAVCFTFYFTTHLTFYLAFSVCLSSPYMTLHQVALTHTFIFYAFRPFYPEWQCNRTITNWNFFFFLWCCDQFDFEFNYTGLLNLGFDQDVLKCSDCCSMPLQKKCIFMYSHKIKEKKIAEYIYSYNIS